MSTDRRETTFDDISGDTERDDLGSGGMESPSHGGSADPEIDEYGQMCDDPSLNAEFAHSDSMQECERELEELMNRDETTDEREGSQDWDSGVPPPSTMSVTGLADSHAPTLHSQCDDSPNALNPNGDNIAQNGRIRPVQNLGPVNHDPMPPSIHLTEHGTTDTRIGDGRSAGSATLEARSNSRARARGTRRSTYVQSQLNLQPAQTTTQPPRSTTENTTSCARSVENSEPEDLQGPPRGADLATHRDGEPRTTGDGLQGPDTNINTTNNSPEHAGDDEPRVEDGARQCALSGVDPQQLGDPNDVTTDAVPDYEAPNRLGKLVFYPYLGEGDKKRRVTAASVLASLEMTIAGEYLGK